jgi:hypothetical protein
MHHQKTAGDKFKNQKDQDHYQFDLQFHNVTSCVPSLLEAEVRAACRFGGPERLVLPPGSRLDFHRCKKWARMNQANKSMSCGQNPKDRARAEGKNPGAFP